MLEDLQLTDIMIMYDRDFGISIFQNFRGYDSLLDDAEWLLERTHCRSRGFLIRVVMKGEKTGLWIGEYLYGKKGIVRQELIFQGCVGNISKAILDYASGRISEDNLLRRIRIENLRELKSNVIRDFKYYYCPSNRFLYECSYVNEIYSRLVEKYGRENQIPYSLLAREVEKIEPCRDVIICPLVASNMFERILNLNRALKTRRIGEIKFVTPDFVEIT
ncbi:hypothetical protein J7K07_06935 [Candidatus Bathyarchaeota archaeon]|nr:hypothetical protein [Candidatus Bathyarchaeota archaeon]